MTLPTMMVALSMLASGCITNAREFENPEQAFDLPDTDCLLIEWQNCSEDRPCIHGDWNGRAYALGFSASPALVAGKFGDGTLSLALDDSSIFSYGNRVIEMTFTDAKKHAYLDVTWNELDQKLIDAQFVADDE